MAHGERAQNPNRFEFNKSRLHRWGEDRGRATKALTHRFERRTAKAEVRREADNSWWDE